MPRRDEPVARQDEPSSQPTTQLPAPPAPSGPADQRTTQLPPLPPSGPAGQPTTQLPPPPSGPANRPEPAGEQAGNQATTRFPRPPDDEDLGHIDH